jgi:hypothetical protein
VPGALARTTAPDHDHGQRQRVRRPSAPRRDSTSLFTSPNRIAPGNEGQTNTPTACCASFSPRTQT